MILLEDDGNDDSVNDFGGSDDSDVDYVTKVESENQI